MVWIIQVWQIWKKKGSKRIHTTVFEKLWPGIGNLSIYVIL